MPRGAASERPDDAASAPRPAIPLSALVDRLAAQGPGLVMTMGKGGVGKTTLAAALAVALAERGHRVTLTTTDPAAHVDSVLPDPTPLLRVTRIDPAAETAEHTARVLRESAETLDAAALALLQEDLASPCTEEVAVFLAFARTVAEAAHEYVVLDTAPTGHTLLLLDAAGSFSRQARAQTGTTDAQVAGLLTALRDPAAARILLVALPEATPVHEAVGLQDDLRRAGIEPAAWIVNSALSATATRDPLLLARARREGRWIDEIAAQGAGTPVVVPWQCESPVGTAALSRLTR